jgi:hypothetical protein
MDVTSAKVRILLIRPWFDALAPIRAVLRDAGFTARITRVDLETALDVALSRGQFDVVVFDPTTKLSLDVVEMRIRTHGAGTPIITLGALGELIPALTAALIARIN